MYPPGLVRLLFTLTIFAGSALLFLVQPIVGRMVLPLYGGTAAVWTTSLLFFQALLLAGYAYAHFSLRWLGTRTQPWLHLGLFAVGVAACSPITVRAAGPGGGIPAAAVLAALWLAVGPLFFVLAAGSPTLQRWFGGTGDRAAPDPYFLYASSNAGSLLGLLSYPFLLEPRLPLARQADLVVVGACAVGVLTGLCGIAVAAMRGGSEREAVDASDRPPTAGTRLRWVALAAVPSSLLMSVTTYFTTDLAPIPLLWVVPLAIYLLTFVVAFSRRNPFGPTAYARVVPVLVAPLVLVLVLEATSPLLPIAALHLAAFGVLALALHVRLAADRPGRSRLTEFYLWVALGGVVGGVANALVAPVVFRTVLEYPLGLVLGCALLAARPGRAGFAWPDLAYPLAVAALTVLVAVGLDRAGVGATALRTGMAIGAPCVLAFFASDRPLRFALSVGAVYTASVLLGTGSTGQVLATERSFFGVHRVKAPPDGRYRVLLHGNTIHGRQSTLPEKRGVPLTYYHPTGPVGLLFSALNDQRPPTRVGLVGLGVGSLAAYGRLGQRYTFFEIDPVVVRLARDADWFTYLSDSQADVEVVVGDARLTLADHEGGFDVLVLDAFSSDAIPIHLLTREAMALYVSKLAPRGVVAFHVSNRFLDLVPVLAAICADLGLAAWVNDDSWVSDDERREGKSPSVWVAITPDRGSLEPLLSRVHWEPLGAEPGHSVWTDDYAPVLSAFRR